MKKFSIGVMTESFRLPTWPDGVKKAREIGADGIQLYVTDGQMKAEDLTKEQRRDFRQFMADNGLVISALCGDIGGFSRESQNETILRRTKCFIDLAVDLGTAVVTTHFGVVPDNPDSPIYQNQFKLCRELGKYASERGVSLAAETGPEAPEILCRFLDDVDSPGIGVNLDPANLVMVNNNDPVKAVYTLRKYIRHTHAKDGVFLKSCDPVKLYESFAENGIEAFDWGTCFKEVPLGTGQVDWNNYLNALEEIGYHGFLTIEREVGENPVADISTALAFLKKAIG